MRAVNEGLVELFEYNLWANQTLFEACGPLGMATLSEQPPGISGTIGSLLTHIVGGEQTFLLRTQGRQHEGELNRASPFSGVDELLRIASEVGRGLRDTAAALQDGAAIDLSWQGKTYRFPVRFFLVHAIEHSMEHRTELKVGLNQLGIETPDLDGWSYAAAKGYGAEV
jgi:uncharacterized damage-inducible protein DinB